MKNTPAKDVVDLPTLELLCTIADIPHIVITGSTKIQALNQAAIEWIHTDEKNLTGKKVANVFPTDIAEMIKNMLSQLVEEDTHQIVRYVARSKNNVVPLRMIGIHPPGQEAIHYFIVPITDRDEVDKMVNDEEMRYRLIFENTGTATCMFGNDGIITRCNLKFEELVGFPREQIEGNKQLEDFIVPEDFIRLSGYHRQRSDKKGDPPTEYEFDIYNRKGEIRHLLMKISIDPKTMERIASLIDITDWVVGERLLKEQKIFYENIIQQLPVGVLVKDIENEFRFMVWNRVMEKITGLSSKETLGKRDFDVTALAELANSYLYDDLETIEKRVFKEIDEEYIDTGRKTSWVHTKKGPIFDETGKARYILGILEDITLKRLSENMLRIKDAAIDSSPSSIAIVDMNGIFTYVNNAVLKLLDVESQMKLIGKHVRDIFGDENDMDEVLHNIMEYGFWNGDLFFRDSTSTKRIIAITSSLVKDRDGNPISVIGIGSDITERKNLAEEQIRLQKLDSLGILAGGIAHDFNNLLLIMQGNIEMVMMNLAESSQDFENLQETTLAIRRAKSLTNQLLTFSKGGAPILESTSLDSIIKESAHFVLRGSRTVCNFEHPNDLNNVIADRNQLSQVIQNIVLNASMAMPNGGTVRITADNVQRNCQNIEGLEAPDELRDYVHIRITDHGHGISEENLARIFDPYFTTRETGHGLGLAVVHSIIRKHKGKITVCSEEGKFTTFDICLPASKEKEEEDPGSMHTVISWSGKILAVDDQKEICDMLKRLGKHLGYRIDTALSGARATELFTEAFGSDEPYKLLLLDLTIPGEKGGVEILKDLRQIDPDIKAVATTGYSEIRVVGDLKNAGFDDVIMKPYNVQKLSRILENLMNPSSTEDDS